MPAAIPAIIAGGAALAGGAMAANAQGDAADSASNAQITASREANQLQREQYNDTRNLMRPVAEAGADARARQMLMQGFSPEEVRAFLASSQGAWANNPGGMGSSDADLQARYPDQYAAWQQTSSGPGGLIGALRPNQRQTFSQFLTANGLSTAPQQTNDNDWVDDWSYEATSPSYGFRMDQGTQALERSQAARGRLFSGATGMALQRYGQDLASQEFEADFRRLGSLSGAGDDAQGVTINAGTNYANQAGQNINNAGAARASGYLANGEAQANFWGNTVPGALGTVAGGWKGWK